MTEPACRVVCPVPPSANNLFIAGNGRRRWRAPSYKEWTERAGWAIKLQRPTPIKGKVRIEIVAPIDHHRDLDNIFKAVLDLLCPSSEKNITGLGIIEDDRWVEKLSIERCDPESRASGDLVISIWPHP